MAVARAGEKLNHLGAELLVDGVDELAGFLARDQSGGGVIHDDIRTEFFDVRGDTFGAGSAFRFQRDHRAEVDDVVFANRDTQAGRLERPRIDVPVRPLP